MLATQRPRRPKLTPPVGARRRMENGGTWRGGGKRGDPGDPARLAVGPFASGPRGSKQPRAGFVQRFDRQRLGQMGIEAGGAGPGGVVGPAES